MDSLLSVEEAARRLGGLSKYTVHSWLAKGKLLRTKVGSRTMIRESELLKVIQDGGKSPGRPRDKEGTAATPRSRGHKKRSGAEKLSRNLVTQGHRQ